MKLLKWLLAILVVAWAGQYLLAMVAPNLIMEMVYLGGAKQGGYNQLLVRPVPDETARTVVRPSPDLLYASCLYNLEDGPIVIEAPIPALLVHAVLPDEHRQFRGHHQPARIANAWKRSEGHADQRG
ncbi:MAG: DUF1254 domain-containing protein [Haliea sp.]|nr:DUF1254 domain-containing protein [Haliea sp.]